MYMLVVVCVYMLVVGIGCRIIPFLVEGNFFSLTSTESIVDVGG